MSYKSKKELLSKYDINMNDSGIHISINFKAIGARIDLAQNALDMQIGADILECMPMDTGNLRGQTAKINASVAGTGQVYKYNPNVEYAHYIYEGEKYVDPVYRKGGFFSPDYGFWSRPNVTKVPSGEPLQYTHPDTGAHWDDIAFNRYKDDWVEVVRRVIEG